MYSKVRELVGEFKAESTYKIYIQVRILLLGQIFKSKQMNEDEQTFEGSQLQTEVRNKETATTQFTNTTEVAMSKKIRVLAMWRIFSTTADTKN